MNKYTNILYTLLIINFIFVLGCTQNKLQKQKKTYSSLENISNHTYKNAINKNINNNVHNNRLELLNSAKSSDLDNNKTNLFNNSQENLSIPTYTINAKQVSSRKVLPKNLVDEAYKEYINAYNNYVKMLRESGPQTLETLNALAEYQKKYQLYLIIKNAENELRSNNTPSNHK